MTITALIFDFGNVLATWSPHNLYKRFFPNNPQAIDAFLKEIDFHHWNIQQDRPLYREIADIVVVGGRQATSVLARQIEKEIRTRCAL